MWTLSVRNFFKLRNISHCVVHSISVYIDMKVLFQNITYCPSHLSGLLGQCPVRDYAVEASGSFPNMIQRQEKIQSEG